MQITNGEFFVCSSFILLPYYATIYAKRKKTETPFQGTKHARMDYYDISGVPLQKQPKISCSINV